MRKPNFYTLFFVFFSINIFSQISPPGLGKGKTAEWLAFGVRKDLDTINGGKWQSMTYIGLGIKDDLLNNDQVSKPTLFVANQEFYHQFRSKWQYSLAISYRIQNEDLEQTEYNYTMRNVKNEYRFYSRLSYILNSRRLKFVPTIRQEIRMFKNSQEMENEEFLQLRSRVRLQLTLNLDLKKQHKLIASSEQLFSISKEKKTKDWTKLKYQESRFSLYYSYSPNKAPFILSVGYMNNVIGLKNPLDVHYLAFDVVLKIPYK